MLGSDEAMRFYPQSTWPAFYGLKTLDDLQTEKGKQLRADVDMLGLITPDDPPVWLGAGTATTHWRTEGTPTTARNTPRPSRNAATKSV